MNIIVSETLKSVFNQFTVVQSLKEVTTMTEKIDVLIMHSCQEDSFNAGVFISRLYEGGLRHYVYIKEKPDPSLLLVLRGVDCRVFTDEFYFEDEEELVSLLDECFADEVEESSTTELAIVSSTFDIMQEFIELFVRGDKRVQTRAYLDNVVSAMNELQVLTQTQQTQLATMGESALDIFKRASTIISKMNDNRKVLEQKLQNYEQSTVSRPTSKASFGNSIMNFPTVRYAGSASVFLVREYSPTKYLTSLMLGYHRHVHYELNRRVKIIFVHQKGQGVSAKYDIEGFATITQESLGMTSLYDSEMIATNTPKKDVMLNLIGTSSDMIVIIVDRLYQKDAIVTGRVTQVNAAGSRSDIQRFKLAPEDTIFSVTPQPNNLFCIPTMKGFPVEVDARYALYSQQMKDCYKEFDKRLRLAT